MDRYTVKLLSKAFRDVDDIYRYISEEFLTPEAAQNIITAIEDAIFSLEEFPYRCAVRKIGIYANKGYRQIVVKNFTVVFRIDEDKKYLIVVTIKYSPSSF